MLLTLESVVSIVVLWSRMIEEDFRQKMPVRFPIVVYSSEFWQVDIRVNSAV